MRADSRPGKIRTAVIVEDGRRYNVRQIGVEEYGGNCRVNLFGLFDNFVCHTEVETCSKENKSSVRYRADRGGRGGAGRVLTPRPRHYTGPGFPMVRARLDWTS